MSIKFNLLLLHRDTDVHPRSWICIKGTGIKELIFKLENEVKIQNNITREELSRRLSKKFNCVHTVIKTIFQCKKEFYPIAVILEMVKLCKNGRTHLRDIVEKIDYLKVNSARSKPVIAIKTLTMDLAKIIGAFMADGSLTYQIIVAAKNNEDLEDAKHTLEKFGMKFSEAYSKSRKEYFISFFPNYNNFDKAEDLIKLFSKKYQIQVHMRIELTDEYKNSVEAFNGWMKNCFGVEPSMFCRRENSWRTSFSNKILSRYLICFFGVKSGYKAGVAFEPEIIKKSSIRMRKAFALGVITFDGSCTISGNISLDTKSRSLFDSICAILAKINVKFGTKFARETYNITTHKNNDFQKLNELFEKNTIKWFRFEESYKETKENDFESRYKRFTNSKITFDELIQVLNQVKVCDVGFLTKRFNCAHYSVSHYLNILKNNKKIRISSKPRNFNFEFVSPTTTVYLKTKFHNKIFNLIKERFAEHKKFGVYMGIDHSTISAWKVRKNRIPLPTVKRFCDILNINPLEINKNVEEVDRRIIEIT